MQEIEVFECYVKTDIEGKGIASLVQAFYASNEILQDEKGKEMVEEVDYVPFHSICPIPIPHKFFGNSLADRTTDIQPMRLLRRQRQSVLHLLLCKSSGRNRHSLWRLRSQVLGLSKCM